MGSTADPHVVNLPCLSCEDAVELSEPELYATVETWVHGLNDALCAADFIKLKSLIHGDAWMRDLLAMSWDFRTLNGQDKIIHYMECHLTSSGIQNIRLRKSAFFQPNLKQLPDVEWVEAMFDFETKVGLGSGIVRLVKDAGSWKVFMISFMLQKLKIFNETTHLNRPHGGNNSLGGSGNWQERRERQKEFLDEDPAVVVIGAGQSGLDVGARLGQLGVSTLIIDKNDRIGDNWRNRYRTLVTHDPVQYTHMPYIPFPSSWPMFTPKDKIADWFEAYASLMELNVWTKTTIETSSYDETAKSWTVTLRCRDGSFRTLRPRHIVFATGHSGEALVPSFPGQDQFKGTTYHTSSHKDASLDPKVAGKTVVVVGTGNSGHDICQNYYENGADVTMLQRGGTYVLTAEKGVFMLHAGLYDETGPPTEDADIYAQSMPIPVAFNLSSHLTKRIAQVDKDLLDGLTKAGFELDSGPQGAGIMRKYLTRGGGYYIDVGCSELIADGKVKVRQSRGGIKAFNESGLVLADGSTLSADVVVLATGYDNMRTSARKIFGNKVADRLHDVWDLNDEGELNAMWRYSGHPGFWYIGGNLALCRIYSLLLGLQIKACEEGLYVTPINSQEEINRGRMSLE
ncbi:hypothetical protein H634G_10157 [Metarhizium anisopliae BRIP 53293]|uniref:FAD/NAD(P)-binding domain-containing protein n=1 Tax=Metarhizium anisopliae BRIP 53293 TaxID=1291518 RepID=A0A0D9NLK6_METAN|nr:hypothetical protein H634G_10157 [Metarhizium anisopliae BRIP 53293]KJK85568.1 hypothetical protein H633G_10588 [Metarhizium anisopliae BRIP 53284]